MTPSTQRRLRKGRIRLRHAIEVQQEKRNHPLDRSLAALSFFSDPLRSCGALVDALSRALVLNGLMVNAGHLELAVRPARGRGGRQGVLQVVDAWAGSRRRRTSRSSAERWCPSTNSSERGASRESRSSLLDRRQRGRRSVADAGCALSGPRRDAVRETDSDTESREGARVDREAIPSGIEEFDLQLSRRGELVPPRVVAEEAQRRAALRQERTARPTTFGAPMATSPPRSGRDAERAAEPRSAPAPRSRAAPSPRPR